MIKISKLADYAVVIVGCMSEKPESLFSAHFLADETHIPEPTVSKILKLLSKSDVVCSTRGVNGGYSLTRDIKDISAKEVLEAIEGPIHLTECVDEGHECVLEKHCPSYGRWDTVNKVITNALDDVKVAELIK